MPAQYDLSSLNGVTFSGNEASFGVAVTPPSGAATSAPLPAGPDITVDHDDNNYSIFASVTVDSVNNSTYVPGHFDATHGYYYLPTFGSITVTISDGSQKAPITETLYVHGFQDDGQGLIVSDKANLTFYNGSAQVYAQAAYFNPSNTGPSQTKFGVLENSPMSGAGNVSHHFSNDGSAFHAAPAPVSAPAPFDLSSLNGVVLTGGDISIGPGVPGANGTGAGVQIDGSTSDNNAGVESIYKILSKGTGQFIGYNPSQPDANTAKIVSTNNIYNPGHVTNGHYYLPTFGTIVLQNSFTGVEQTYYVHGFEGNGRMLLVSSRSDLFFNKEMENGYYIEQGYHAQGAAESYVGVISLDSLGAPSFPLVFTNDGSAFEAAACYAEGVRILTVRGEVAVEDLVEGDEVVLASGGTRPVIWIGNRRIRCDRHPSPRDVNPVRIRKGAFGDDLPMRDLILSPGHAVFVDGVLAPAIHLVNGATIVQEAVEAVRYFHVELDAHDVILAEGLPCESYLNDGNRDTFANGPEHAVLHGRLDPQSWENACAPVVAGGPQLAEIQQRLHVRAEAMGWSKTEEPNLRLIADGVTIAPAAAKGGRYWFTVPAAKEVVLASNASVLAHTLPGLPDERRLGVAVADVRLDGQSLDITGRVFAQGFHELEIEGDLAWRWTDGAGRLALDLDEPSLLEVVLLMVAPVWKRPAVELRLLQA